MDKLRCIEVFVTAVDEGSFSAAARVLDISSVMVGKQVRQLEQHLGTRLLQRTTRHQSLTEAGRSFYQEGRKLLEQLSWAEASVERLKAEPSGDLRITVQNTLGAFVMGQVTARYQALHPQVSITVDLSNSVVDLAQEGFDLAIRVGAISDQANFVARPLGHYRMVICASPEYLRAHGTPTTPADLAHHHCLSFMFWNPRTAWRLRSPEGESSDWPLHSRLQSNDAQVLRHAALQGAGLLLQPRLLVVDDLATGRLVPVLESYLPAPRPVHVVWRADRQPLPKISSFVAFLREHMPRMLP